MTAAEELERMADILEECADGHAEQGALEDDYEYRKARLNGAVSAYESACMVLRARAAELRAQAKPDESASPVQGYEIVGECAPSTGDPPGSPPEPRSAWISRKVARANPGRFQFDPTSSRSPELDRWCLITTTGGIELRRGDRVVVLRPASRADKPERVEVGQMWRGGDAWGTKAIVSVGDGKATFVGGTGFPVKGLLTDPRWVYLGKEET